MSQLLRDIQNDLEIVINEDLGVKCVLISPDGQKQEKSALDQDKYLKCALFQEIASFHVRSLSRIPKDGEQWAVRIQLDPFSDELTSYAISGPPKPGRSVGFINLRLRRVTQQ